MTKMHRHSQPSTNMKKQLFTLAFIGAAFIGCTKSDEHDHAAGNHHHDSVAASTTQHNDMSGASMETRMQTMNSEMVQHLGPADADYDHRFIDMMIPHHEGAVMMAKDALQKSQRPEIKKMAEEMIAAQEKEIAQLKAWGEEWYHKH
jgi:uncharacterized protein (DUF305 family)